MKREKEQGIRGKGIPAAGPSRPTRFCFSALSCLLIAGLFALTPFEGHAEVLTIRDGLGVISSQGYDMRIARAKESSAEWEGLAARARLKPQVSAYADQTWLENRPEAVFGAGTSPMSEDHFLRYGVTVRQIVTDFGRTRAGVEAAQAGSRSKAQETVLAQNDGALEFILSYISLLQAQRNVSLADQIVQRYEAHLTDAQALHQAGEVTFSDVLVVQVALANARLGQIDARDALDLSASRVNFLILRPFNEPVEGVEFSSLPVEIPDREDVIAAAEGDRVELKIMDEQVMAAEARLRFSEAGRFPSLFVGGGYSYEENPYRVHEDNWSATVGLTWDLYTGGARKASEGQASGTLSAIIAQREKVSRMVGLEAIDAHRLLTGAAQREEVAGKATRQAQENLRLQRARYNEGEASASEVTDAITALAQAELNRWSSIYGIRRAQAKLMYAMGTDLVDIYSTSGTTGPTSLETGEKP